MAAFNYLVVVTSRTMSDLSEAMKFVKAARRSDGRDPKMKFMDLCKAVERIIIHLQKIEA